MVSFHVFGLQKCHFRRRKEKKKKKVGKSIGDPVRGRDAPIMSLLKRCILVRMSATCILSTFGEECVLSRGVSFLECPLQDRPPLCEKVRIFIMFIFNNKSDRAELHIKNKYNVQFNVSLIMV